MWRLYNTVLLLHNNDTMITQLLQLLYYIIKLFYLFYNTNYVSPSPNEIGCVVKSCKLTSTAVFVSENFGMHINRATYPSSATHDIHELFHKQKLIITNQIKNSYL